MSAISNNFFEYPTAYRDPTILILSKLNSETLYRVSALSKKMYVFVDLEFSTKELSTRFVKRESKEIGASAQLANHYKTFVKVMKRMFNWQLQKGLRQNIDLLDTDFKREPEKFNSKAIEIFFEITKLFFYNRHYKNQELKLQTLLELGTKLVDIEGFWTQRQILVTSLVHILANRTILLMTKTIAINWEIIFFAVSNTYSEDLILFLLDKIKEQDPPLEGEEKMHWKNAIERSLDFHFKVSDKTLVALIKKGGKQTDQFIWDFLERTDYLCSTDVLNALLDQYMETPESTHEFYLERALETKKSDHAIQKFAAKSPKIQSLLSNFSPRYPHARYILNELQSNSKSNCSIM